jgi:hypothetical protein
MQDLNIGGSFLTVQAFFAHLSFMMEYCSLRRTASVPLMTLSYREFTFNWAILTLRKKVVARCGRPLSTNSSGREAIILDFTSTQKSILMVKS